MVIGIISVGFGSRFRVVDLEADLVVLFHQLPGDEPDSSNLSWHESRDGAGCHADDLVASKQRGGQTHPADSLPVVRHSNDHLSVPLGAYSDERWTDAKASVMRGALGAAREEALLSLGS